MTFNLHKNVFFSLKTQFDISEDIAKNISWLICFKSIYFNDNLLFCRVLSIFCLCDIDYFYKTYVLYNSLSLTFN